MRGEAVVVGAGIGGLAVGRALHQDGWRVRLLEREPGLPRTGTALGMWPEAVAALARLGVADLVRERGVRQHGATFLRPDGTTFGRVVPDEPAHLVSRPALHELLYRDALEDVVEWGSRVDDLADLPQADLVVGADGLRSRVRERVTGGPNVPRPLGTVAFRGVVPGGVDAVTETWGRGRLFGITPQDARTTNWFACVREDLLAERAGATSDVETLHDLFGDWHDGVAEVVRAVAREGDVDRRTLYDAAPLSSMVRGNAPVIGDAAHAMAPNAGRGACEALIDAVALADALRHARSVPEGLRAFDRARLAAGRRTARLSRALNRLSTGRRLDGARRRVMGALARAA